MVRCFELSGLARGAPTLARLMSDQKAELQQRN